MTDVMIAEVRSLTDLTTRHQEALLVHGQLSRRLEIVSEDGSRFGDEDKTALLAAREDADSCLRSIEEYAPINIEEQMTKALYMSALMLAQPSQQPV